MKLIQELGEEMRMEPLMEQYMKKRDKKEVDMEESVKKLRFDFEAETDITIEKSPEEWQSYALWLEKLTIDKLNNQAVKENVVLKDMMQEAMNLLQEGIIKRID